MSDSKSCKTVSMDRLEYDVLEAVSKPMGSIDGFASSVLDALERNVESTSYLFYRYQRDTCNCRELTVTGQVARGLSEELYGETWSKNHFKTSIYNPNRIKKLIAPDGGLLKLTDIITLEEYESSRNFREVISPNGLYYSCSAYLAYEGRLLGYISLSREKCLGDFDDFDFQRIKNVLSYVRNKLLDYNRMTTCGNENGLVRLFSGFVHDGAPAAMVLDECGHVLFYNERMLDYAIDIYGDTYVDTVVGMLADKLIANCGRCFNVVQVTGKKDIGYSCSLSPCGVFVDGELNRVYLVQISNESRVQLSLPGVSREAGKLTERQLEIVQMMIKGMSTREMADAMCVTEATVRKHVENMREALGVTSRMGILKKLNLL